VITLGRSGVRAHVLADEAERLRLGIELRESGRGGDVTYHGPGQLVGYPIVALRGERRDAGRYLRDLEESLIRVAAACGVLAGRIEGLTGVWADGRKLAAIGVRISSGWIASHGFALNVHNDLTAFRTIVPCGIPDRGVTSILERTGTRLEVREVARLAAPSVAEVLGLVPADAPDPAERLAPARPRPVSSSACALGDRGREGPCP
jgi:lipoyl(octanoyl) transferase